MYEAHAIAENAKFFRHSPNLNVNKTIKTAVQYAGEFNYTYNSYAYSQGVGQLGFFTNALVGEEILIRFLIFSIGGLSINFSIAFSGNFLLNLITLQPGLYILPQLSELGYCKDDSQFQIIDDDFNQLSGIAGCYRFGVE